MEAHSKKEEQRQKVQVSLETIQEEVNSLKRTVSSISSPEHSLGKRKLPQRNRRASISEDFATGQELEILASARTREEQSPPPIVKEQKGILRFCVE